MPHTNRKKKNGMRNAPENMEQVLSYTLTAVIMLAMSY